MALNYEQFEPPAAMIAECDKTTLGELRSIAETLDGLFAEAFGSELGTDGIDRLSAERDERIVDTIKRFSDCYEGQSVALLLSDLLRIALTSVYMVEYQLNNLMLDREINEIVGGE